jgi:hypothetical protein
MTEPVAPQAQNSNVLAIVSLIAGLAAGATSLVPVLGLLLGVLAIVLGIVALRRKQNAVLAIIGIVLGAGGAIAGLFFTIAWIGLGAATGTA